MGTRSFAVGVFAETPSTPSPSTHAHSSQDGRDNGTDRDSEFQRGPSANFHSESQAVSAAVPRVAVDHPMPSQPTRQKLCRIGR